MISTIRHPLAIYPGPIYTFNTANEFLLQISNHWQKKLVMGKETWAHKNSILIIIFLLPQLSDSSFLTLQRPDKWLVRYPIPDLSVPHNWIIRYVIPDLSVTQYPALKIPDTRLVTYLIIYLSATWYLTWQISDTKILRYLITNLSDTWYLTGQILNINFESGMSPYQLSYWFRILAF